MTSSLSLLNGNCGQWIGINLPSSVLTLVLVMVVYDDDEDRGRGRE